MKAFVATRVSGESREKLLTFLEALKDALRSADVEPYITELAPPQPDDGNKLLRAFEHIAESDLLIVIYKLGSASEGMSAEIGYAYGKKSIWIYAERGSESKLFACADKLEYWGDESELLRKIETTK